MSSKQNIVLYLGSIFILLNAYDTDIFNLYPNGYSGFKVLEVTPKNSNHVQELRNFALNSKFVEFWKGVSIGRTVPILTPPDKVEELKTFLNSIDLHWNITMNNFQDAIDHENERSSRMRNADEDTFWHEYHSLDEIYNYLDILEKNYDFVSTENIGKTWMNRNMKIAKVCKGVCGSKKAVWIDGGIHAREWISPATVTWLLKELVENDHAHPDLTEKLDWYILPVHNPDGYEYTREKDRNWRKTRSNSEWKCPGVDANRNYDFHWGEGLSVSTDNCNYNVYIGPEPFSEIETRNVRDFILSKKGQWIFYDSIHSFSQMILLPWAYTQNKPGEFEKLKEISEIGAAAIKNVHGEEYQVGSVPDLLYTCGGISLDWAYGVAEIPYATTLELRPKLDPYFVLPPDQIIPTGQETWAFHEAVIRHLLEQSTDSISDGNLLSTIPLWGPSFRIKFSISVNSFDNGLGPYNPWSDVLHFTSTEKTCCDFGDRLPGVFLHKDNRVIIGMNVDVGKGTIYYTSGRLSENRWYTYEIKQEEGVFTVRLDGDLHFRHVNTDPMSFENVRVFAVFPGAIPADAQLKNLYYGNLSD